MRETEIATFVKRTVQPENWSMATFISATWAVVAAAILFSGAAAANPPADKTTKDARQFLELVKASFAQWDTDHDGRLSRVEIETDMQDPKIKGDSAAALAALKWGMNGADPTAPKEYTLADLDTMEKILASGKKLDQPYPFHFTDGQRKLRAEMRELFSDAVPHLAAIRQDSTSDCYFNSAVGSIAQASPQTIVKLIQPNSDGTFTVTFPGKASQRISAPTDAEIAAYSDAADGIWFNLLEKAYATIRPIDPKSATKEPLDAAALIGGDENGVLALVSGHRTKVTRFPLITNRSVDANFLQQVRADLQSAFRDHRAVVAAKFHHAFAVVAFDPRTDTITVHNPYDGNGGEGMPDGESGVSSAGFIAISTDKFVETFKSMGVEQAALLTH
jgi:hypothetical protein